MDVLDISVRNPVKVVGEETYTTFEIYIQTTNIAFSLPKSVTRRRFSEFLWLRKKLKAHHPQIKPPALPKKSLFGERFDPEFVSVRMKSLEEFLFSCFGERLYFSDSSLHLFIQSCLSCVQIEDYLHGALTQSRVEEARRSCHISEKEVWMGGEVTADIQQDRQCEADRESTSSPMAIPPSHWDQFSKDLASSDDSISDSLESDMYLSCAVGPGSIQ